MKLPASWKTTAGGIVVGLMLILPELADLFGITAGEYTNGEFDFETVVLGLGAMGIGWFARDDKVSSEKAGAR